MNTPNETPRSTIRYTSNGVRIECETHINAPRELVWEIIQEPSRRIEWDARLTNCELLTGRPIGKGTRARTEYRMLGWTEIEYTSFQPPLRSAVRTSAVSRGNVIKTLVGSWNVVPQADGTTVWKTQMVVTGVGGARRARVLERVLIGPLMRWLTALSAKNFKRLAEREYAAQTPVEAAA